MWPAVVPVLTAANLARLAAAVASINDIVELIIKAAEVPAVRAVLGLAQAGAGTVKTATDFGRQRRDQELAAEGMGTTTQNVDVLSRTYEGLGLSAEDAAKDLSRFASAMDESFGNTGEGLPGLKKLGVKSVDGNDNRLDAGEVFMGALKKFAERSQDIKDRSDRLEADRRGGNHVDPKVQAKLNEDRASLGALFREFFKDDKVIGAIRSVGGEANLNQLISETLALRPLIDGKTEARHASNAKEETKNDLRRKRIGDIEHKNLLDETTAAIGRAGEKLAEGIESVTKNGEIQRAKKAEQASRVEIRKKLIEKPAEKEGRGLLGDANKWPWTGEGLLLMQRLRAAAAASDKASDQYRRSIGRSAPWLLEQQKNAAVAKENEFLDAAKTARTS